MGLELGTKLEKVIEAIVPKTIIEKVKESGCGCAARKEKLNNLI